MPEAMLKEGVPGIELGKPLPDGTTISEILDSKWQGVLYLIVSISGFELGKGK